MTPIQTPVRVGIIGCGKIIDAYFNGCGRYPVLRIVACADLDPARARLKTAERGIRACTVTELLGDPDIDLILNLTIPAAHSEVNRAALHHGKHVYVEKPFALNTADGQAVLDLARERGLLVGCAPDTFLGRGQQTARDAVDRGMIGRPLSALAFMLCRGHESWHPNPGFYYQAGGGPMFDMGPYYLTALVNLLGPARSVMSANATAFERRTITSQPLAGRGIEVKVPTHYATLVEFANGCVATLVMSFDTPRGPALPRIVLYGTEGSLEIPDPNTFGGTNTLYPHGTADQTALVSAHGEEGGRGSGVADMAYSILRRERKFRATGELAQHVLEIMESADISAQQGRKILLNTTCPQPLALPTGVGEDPLDA